MREFVRGDEYEVASDAASLARIQVRKPKDPIELTARKKVGDITNRLSTLSNQLEQSSETMDAPTAQPPLNRKVEAPGDILDYWMQIRERRRYPSWTALDAEIIGTNWPNCVLIHINKAVGRLQVKYEFTNAIRKAAQNIEPEEALLHRIEFTPMIIDWILAQSRTVAVNGKPCHDTEYFPSLTGEFPLRVIALPMSDDSRSIDHVLCYLQKMT